MICNNDPIFGNWKGDEAHEMSTCLVAGWVGSSEQPWSVGAESI